LVISITTPFGALRLNDPEPALPSITLAVQLAIGQRVEETADKQARRP
jgi:hypothetical protein